MSWSISHHGFSHFLGLFPVVTGTLTIDAANPARSVLDVMVHLDQVETAIPRFDDEVKNRILDTGQYPTAEYRSTSIAISGGRHAKVMGMLTWMGQTHPLMLDVTFKQSGMFGPGFDVGFDGTAAIKRSEWGMNWGLPIIGDEVDFVIEAEFSPKG